MVPDGEELPREPSSGRVHGSRWGFARRCRTAAILVLSGCLIIFAVFSYTGAALSFLDFREQQVGLWDAWTSALRGASFGVPWYLSATAAGVMGVLLGRWAILRSAATADEGACPTIRGDSQRSDR